jgi:hypothetical protein
MTNKGKAVVALAAIFAVMTGLNLLFEEAGVAHPGQAAKLAWFLLCMVFGVGYSIADTRKKRG